MYFDFTPDPKVLIALTHTPMLPLDALCELIDNSIDSFAAAKIQGKPVGKPLIVIELPTRKDVVNNTGILRIRDNGPGMTSENAEKALKAGFSGNNPYDSLGLFGMGFNISTGKIGIKTVFMTACTENDYYIKTVIDLEKINREKNYQLFVSQETKSSEFSQGTVIEISNWWPEGNANRGFLSKLVQYGVPKIREEIGRRYATILKEKEIQIYINDGKCEPFEHCVWRQDRYVERKSGRVPAIYTFDKVVGSTKRCGACTAIIPDGESSCPACSSTKQRTVEERVRGWIGIQRYDSETDFGIDLIRNGRAIRIAEKSAFFEYVDEFKRSIKDYPIDQQYGRIVGEIHLDFVPVDFLKQDFQRSSDEWQKAMTFLRGNSSLQPNQPNADNNDSILYRLYQGYRRVRTFGKGDMYMGYWDAESQKAKRISRDVEKEYFEKFRSKEPGYYDDTEWWKLVDSADQRPIETMIECPQCSAQNLKEAEICAVCGCVLKGKNCINEECREIIPVSAAICPTCGQSQIPTVETPWHCDVCGSKNSAAVAICSLCSRPKGSPSPLSKDYLLKISNKEDALSLNGFSVVMSDGNSSSPIDVAVYLVKEPLNAIAEKKIVPSITFKDINKITIFVDKSHRLFRTCKVKIEEVVAYEVAMYLYDIKRNLSNYPTHNLTNISWNVILKGWIDNVEDSGERVKQESEAFLMQLKFKLKEAFGEDSGVFFDELSENQQRKMIDNLISLGGDISQLGEMKANGDYFIYAPYDFLSVLLKLAPKYFFNGNIWDIDYDLGAASIISSDLISHAQQQIRSQYINALEDIVSFCTTPYSDSLLIQRTRLSLEFLKQKVVE